MTPQLLVLCGIPASGKTTFAHMLLDKLEQSNDRTILISTDEWRDKSYYENFEPENEQRVRQIARERVREAIGKSFNVIFDDTNYYASMRHEMYEIAKEHECVFGIIFISTPLETALHWNEKRERPLKEDIIERIHERLDRPGAKYAWDTPIAVIDMSRNDLETLMAEVVRTIQTLKPIKEKERERPGRAEHYDKLTRRIVTAFLDAHPQMRGNEKVKNERKRALRRALAENLEEKEIEMCLRGALLELVEDVD